MEETMLDIRRHTMRASLATPVIVAVALVVALFAVASGCATITSSVADNGVAQFDATGPTLNPSGSFEQFAHGVEAIERARADVAYVRAVDGTAVWYAQQGTDSDAAALADIEGRLARTEVAVRCVGGDRKACEAAGATAGATAGAVGAK